ncbi:hypothetical protein GCM10017673_52570 [Streptosporangium violaceochromogenes]|nr:hypothetical protein GCM10017673_52570 [Streptosporangium violaceochromogenes]
MTENNQSRDYAGFGRDFTWTQPSPNGTNGASPPGEGTGPPPSPGGPNGTRAYERLFAPEPPNAEDGDEDGRASGGDPASGTPPAGNVPGAGEADRNGSEGENGSGGPERRDGAAPAGGPGAYYSEWTANDPTATYETLRDEPGGDPRGGPGGRPDGGEGDEPRSRAAQAYESFSGALSGLRGRLRFGRRAAPGPARVRASPRPDTEPAAVTGPTTVTGYRVPLLSRPFLWCAGTDPDLVPNRSELYRYSTIGVFVCLVAFVAATMFAIFASVVGGGFSPAIVPFALLWGVLIFWVDRSIVAEPAYGKVLSEDDTNLLHPVGRSRKPGWLTYLMRVILAVGVSFIIAEAVTLLIFQSEVKDQLAFTQQARVKDLDARFKAADEDMRRRLDATYDRPELCADSRRKERARDAALKKRQDEFTGEPGTGHTGQYGIGPVTRALDADYRKAEREYGIARGRCVAAQKAVDGDFKAYEGRERPRRDADRVNVQKNVGWVAQEKALHDFIEGSDSLIVMSLPWVLRVTILVLDLLPLSVKLLGGPTVYERRLREQAYSQTYETQRLREAHIAKIDMRYDLDRLNTRDSYDRGRTSIRNGGGSGARGTRKYRNQYL